MLIVTEAANLRQVLGGNSICQETHTHTQQSRQNPCPLSISQQQIPGVVLQMPPGPWPSLTLLQQSHSHGQCRLSRGHEMCGVEHGPNQDYVLSNMQKLLLFFFLISGKKQKARIIQVLLKTARERLRLHSDTEHWAMSFFQWQQFRESSTRV